MPFGSCTNPSESEQATTFAPSCCSFSTANTPTLPEPETMHVLASRSSPVCCSTFRGAKKAAPYPVASLRTCAPPQTDSLTRENA